MLNHIIEDTNARAR